MAVCLKSNATVNDFCDVTLVFDDQKQFNTHKGIICDQDQYLDISLELTAWGEPLLSGKHL